MLVLQPMFLAVVAMLASQSDASASAHEGENGNSSNEFPQLVTGISQDSISSPSLRGAVNTEAMESSDGAVINMSLNTSAAFECPSCDRHCRSIRDPCDSHSWNDPHYSHNGWCWKFCTKYNWQCGGDSQSPINLHSSISTTRRWNLLASSAYRPVRYLVTKKGHSGIEVAGRFGKFRDGRGTHYAKSFHIHCPSEHQIDSLMYSCELHVVHTDYSGRHVTAVIALLFYPGAANRLLMRLGVADSAGVKPQTNRRIPGSINMYQELSILRRGFYKYSGSLTTPPCTEGVTWYVASNHMTMSWNQVHNMKLLGKNENRRDPVGLNGRKVYRYAR